MDRKNTSLGDDDQLNSTLKAVSMGELSIMEASRRLALPDAGYVFRLLAAMNLPLPRLPDEFIALQLAEGRGALNACVARASVD